MINKYNNKAMKQTLFFSFKVYLTTAIVGPVLTGILLILIDPVVNSYNNSVDIFFYTMIVGFVFCLPSWFLTGWLTAFLLKQNLKLITIKALLNIAGIFLLIFTLGILNHNYILNPGYWPSILPMLICYVVVLSISLWLYKPVKVLS
jgi:hypothetical protein